MNDERLMENLTVPDLPMKPNKEFKTAMANSKRSAALGIWLVITPLFFLFCVFMKYFFNIHLHLFTIMEEFLTSMDRDPVMHWLSPVIFIFFPFIAVGVNAMAMMNVQWNRAERQTIVTVKIRFTNLILLLVSLTILAVIGLYLITKTIKV
jgi:lantibiotic transport system permease protein